MDDHVEGSAFPGVYGVCRTCEGTGLALWSRTHEGDGECDECHSDEDRPLDMWDRDTEYSVCEPCACRLHAEACGCSAEGWVKT